jgi:hypothetical protein
VTAQSAGAGALGSRVNAVTAAAGTTAFGVAPTMQTEEKDSGCQVSRVHASAQPRTVWVFGALLFGFAARSVRSRQRRARSR